MLPRPLYEALPFIYVLAGLMSILNLELIPGRLSGALLLSAGAVVFTLRRVYRQG